MSGFNPDILLHVRGESRYVDDLTPPAGCLHAAVVPSPLAHGRLRPVQASRRTGEAPLGSHRSKDAKLCQLHDLLLEVY